MIPVSTKPTKEFIPVPKGNHVARIYSIIHIGTTEKETQWGLKEQNKLRITWELPNELREFKEGEGEKPLSISQEYTISFGEKAHLRKMIDGLLGDEAKDFIDGDAFDIEGLLGRACMVNVQHSSKGEKTYANVVGVAPIPKGIPEPEAVNTPYVLNYTDKWDEEKFSKLPEFIRKKMEETFEYKALHSTGGDVLLDDDGTPF